MALKAYDGFGPYNAIADLLARFGWLQWTSAGNGGIVAPGPFGGDKYFYISDINSNDDLIGSWAQNLTTFYVGQRVNMYVPSGGVNKARISFVDATGGAVQFSVNLDRTTAAVIINNSAGVQLASSNNNVYPINTWFFLEVGGTIDPTAGSITVKVNGVTVVTYSGNTRTGTANSWVNSHRYGSGGQNAGSEFYISHVYICDSTVGPGTYPMNTFLTSIGDPRVWYGPPNANSSVAFTPLANTNWQEVSETAMDSDASYNSSSTVGQADLFTTTGFPVMSVVLAVGVIGAYRKDNSGARNASNELKSGTTTVNGTSQPLNTSYTYYQDFWVEDPNTSASWTVANAQAVTFGYHLDS